MTGCGQGVLLTSLLVSVLQIVTRETTEAKAILLDVSGIRINPLECYDRTNSCMTEAAKGYCETNHHYMMDRCPWSCRFCRRAGGDTEKCIDISKHCGKWVSRTECTTRPDFMAQNCKKSCELCGPESDYNVTDTESTCPLWAKAGWCQTDSELLDKCPHSCQKYGVQGASSLDERYITVNFQEASRATAVPAVSEIVAPPAPSAAMSPHSALNLLPSDLRAVLANEWWDPKVLKLSRKQNEYVTHPEPRPVSLPLPPRESNNTVWTGNNTLQMAHSEQRGENETETVTKIDRSEQGEMIAVSATEPLPRAYDALLPKLFLSSGPTWTKGNTNPGEQQDTNYTTQEDQKIWKEEKEEDEDLDRRGHQKGEVPVLGLENERKHSGDNDLDIEMSSSGSGVEMNQGRNMEGEILSSGEPEVGTDDLVKQKADFAVLSPGSGEVQNNRKVDIKMVASGEAAGYDEVNTGDIMSGSGVAYNSRKHRTAFYSPESGQTSENVNIILPENSSSGTEHLENLETAAGIETSSSGNDQFPDA